LGQKTHQLFFVPVGKHEQSMKHVDTTITFVADVNHLEVFYWYGTTLSGQSIRTILEIASATFGFCGKIYCWSRIGV